MDEDLEEEQREEASEETPKKKLDIAKLKAMIPTINVQTCKAAFTNADQFSLMQGLTITVIFYTLLIAITSMNSENVIKNYNDTLISKTVEINLRKQRIVRTPAKPAEFILDGLHEEQLNGGLLPVIRASDKLTSFRAYQHPFTFENLHSNSKPIISFIIKDFGLNKELSEEALDTLPETVSLLLSPYAKLPNEWIKTARETNHEVWLEQPIENNKHNDTGSFTIFHHKVLSEKIQTFHENLMIAQGYVGIASFTDETIKSAEDDYLSLLDENYKRGLGYLELNPHAPNTFENKALIMGAPYFRTDTTIYKMTGEENSFDALEGIAKKQGRAIVIVPSYPKAIKNLSVWLMKVAEADYIAAPVSVAYDLPSQDQIKSNDSGNRSNPTAPSGLSPKDQVEPEHH